MAYAYICQTMTKCTKDMSGGWRMRVALAQVGVHLLLYMHMDHVYICTCFERAWLLLKWV